MDEARNITVFSFGTLRDPKIQLHWIGRVVPMIPAVLRGYRIARVKIPTPESKARGEENEEFPTLLPGSPLDRVEGHILRVNQVEFVQIGEYETDGGTTDAYVCTLVTLECGTQAYTHMHNEETIQCVLVEEEITRAR